MTGKKFFQEIPKKTLWNEYYEITELPQVINPKSGFVYNANHSPFKSTSEKENPDPKNFSQTMGYETYDNNRSTRILELIKSHDKINYETFKSIKNDNSFPEPMNYNFMNINKVFDMNSENYPEVSELIKSIQTWDRKTDSDSFGAGTYAMLYYTITQRPFYKSYYNRNFSEKLIAECLLEVKNKMLKNFNTTDVKLGEFQKLVRGEKEMPIFGMPDVITAMRGVNYKDGRIKISHGESYVGLVRFIDGEVEYESVSPYGSSDNPDSIHYSDQMELLAGFKTKKMTFDRMEIYKNSKKIYHPK